MRHPGRVLVMLVTALLGMGVTAATAATGRPAPHNRPVTDRPGLIKTLTAGGLQPVDLSHGASPTTLAQSLIGGGVTISNVQFTGANNAAGMFTGGTGIIGFDQGIVLSSGTVQTTSTSVPCGDPGTGVEGPNQCDSNSTINNTPGDPLLDQLSGFTTYDAARLDFDFVPQLSTAQFRYVFSSDEYNEYANTGYNDVFAFLVNGTNCAVVPGTSLPVAVDTINGGNPLGTDPQNAQYYVNNDLSDGGGSIDTEMDGLTTVLDCNATVTPNATNHMTLAIADASDQVWDSNVFIEAGSLVSGTQVSTSLSGGGLSGPTITVAPGTDVTDSATLRVVDHDTADGTMTYTVYSDAACTIPVADAGTKNVLAGAVPVSDPVSFAAAGRYYWTASYSGDAVNGPATSPCGDEVLTVSATTDTLAPACAIRRSGTRALFVFRDPNSGLASIDLLVANNVEFEYEPFTPGTTSRVYALAVKNGSGPVSISVEVTDVGGNSRTCP